MERKGLTTQEAEGLLQKYGQNKLPEKKKVSFFIILFNQFNNILSYLLIGAAALSFFISDPIDAFLIIFILLLNALLGFWQEYKASKELEALRKMEVDKCRVIRDRVQIEISSYFLVPGDIVVVESGDKIPADGELIEAIAIQINESSLTGESLPVLKSLEEEDKYVYFGTVVTSGRGIFEVVKTGASTKFGRISINLSTVEDEPSPLEISLKKFSKNVIMLILVIVFGVFVVRVFQGSSPLSMIIPSIALLVAAVPEGLPAVVTIVLASGVRKMYLRKALVRKMVAVESLGAVTLICTDKTGTLTENKMRVKSVEHATGINKQDFIDCAVLCNSATLVLKEASANSSDMDSFDILGDTTEGALLIWAKEQNQDIDRLRSDGKLIEEIPFSLETRMMTVVWQRREKTSYSKGAPEVIFEKAKLTEKEKNDWINKNKLMAEKGLRVLAFSKDNILLGLVGIADPVRKEVKGAMAATIQAGIKVVMVTGDNPLTAKAIGEEAGFMQEGDEVLTGLQLESLTDEELVERIDKIRIFARIDSEQKYRIVKAYQSKGEIVAVTGDGVNDALALKQAQVGVSMGTVGTDVAKEASDIVLLDDNFATLVAAIEQGRLVYSNISKVIKFLLMGNFSEVMLIATAAILGLPTPLLPVHILWINFVTDGLPALALGFDSASPDLMKNPPRKTQGLLSFNTLRDVMIAGSVILAACLGAFYLSYTYVSLNFGRGVVFTLMVILQMFLPFLIRKHDSLFSNKKLLLAVAFVVIMQFAIITIPFLRNIFKV